MNLSLPQLYLKVETFLIHFQCVTKVTVLNHAAS